MTSLFFWRSWHRESRRVYLFLFVLFLLALGWFGVSYWRGLSNVVDWELISQISEISVPAGEVSVGVFDFSYDANNYVVTENYRGSNIQINTLAAYGLLGCLVVCLVIIMVIISALRGFWYYVSVLILIGVILGFRLEQLQLFGTTNKTGVIIALLLYLPITYFFQYIRPGYGLMPRLLTFGGATVLLSVLVYFFAQVPYPALYLLGYGLAVPFALTLVFIILVGHEMISFFLRLITQNNTATSKNSLLHFLIIAPIYLVNLLLLYLKNTGIIDWDIVYFNAFFLLAVAAVVGVWGFKDREVQYKFLVPFQPLGAYLYLSLGITALATLAFLSATANDPALETFEDTIIYTQLGFGLIFFVYVIANFLQPLVDNQRVYQIVYQPPTLPYATSQIVGTIAAVAFLARASFFPFYQAIAGYYNNIGDLHQYQGDLFLAEQYYKLGDQYGYNNHRSAYSLGALAREQNDRGMTAYYFDQAVAKNPTPQAYVNLGNAFEGSTSFFDALFALNQGRQQFPDNAYLQNNTGLVYGSTTVLDSALYYLQEAQKNTNTQDAAQANVLGVLTRSSALVNLLLDSLFQEVMTGAGYEPSQTNALALINRYPQADTLSQTFSTPSDSALNSLEFAHLYNQLFYQRYQPDSALMNIACALVDHPANGTYREPLSFALALNLYQANRVVEAFKIIDGLQAFNPFKKGYYLHLMGLWALEQHAPKLAAQYFQQAAEVRYEEAFLKYGVSLNEALSGGMPVSEVINYWQTLEADSLGVPVAQDMLKLLEDRQLQQAIDTASDVWLYQVLRYRAASLNPSLLQQTWDALDDPNYQALALHDVALLYPRWNPKWINDQYEMLQSQKASLSAAGAAYLPWVATLQAEARQDWSVLATLIDNLTPLTRWHQYLLDYYRARLASQQSTEARQYYEQLIHNPFFAPGFIAAVHYWYPDTTGSEAAYQQWLDAIQTNPNEPALLAEYILSALRLHLDAYAEESLADYQVMVSEKEYEQFMGTYREVQEESVVDF